MGTTGQTGRWLAYVEQFLANLYSGHGIFIHRQSLGATFHAKPACVQHYYILNHLQCMSSSPQCIHFHTGEYFLYIISGFMQTLQTAGQSLVVVLIGSNQPVNFIA